VVNSPLVIALYVGAMAAAVLLFNANAENDWLALGLWAAASVALGLGVPRWSVLLLPLLSLPLAIPLDYADEHLGSDAPLVLWFAIGGGLLSVVLTLAAVGARKLFDSTRAGNAAASRDRR
jgi:hypothetical protein